VGEANTLIQGVLEGHKGTATLQQHGRTQAFALSTLDSVLTGYPAFRDAKLLKVDTDGFDCRVLRGAAELLQQARPLLFFEYDPHLLPRNPQAALEVFSWLRGFEYSTVLVYDNFGDYQATIPLSNAEALEDLHACYSGRRGQRYCDLAVVHGEDEGLATSVRTAELALNLSRG
jgi:hypothetical protein